STFGILYDKRRRAEDCLTFGTDMFRQPPRLEWSDDGGTTWQPVPDDGWQWSLLETQLGIRFQGNTPPQELMAAGDNARVRLCCTVVGDECIEGKAAAEGFNVDVMGEPGEVWQVLDVSDRYH